MPVNSITIRLAAAVALCMGLPAAQAFGFDDVVREAEALARAPHRPAPALPSALADLSYDAYRQLRFRPEQALWRGDDRPFEAQFFHAGRGFVQALQLFEVADGRVRPLQWPASAFTAGTTPPALPAMAQIAGLRLHAALNTPAYRDELIAFLGASYFRALGAGQRYGASARGVAIDTVGGSGEEFPAFTRFWLVKPAPGATQATLYALLDGPRIGGAYRFDVRPGPTTVVEVQARLWLRAPVAMLGVAPLTSMFLAGENQPVADDYRPEVHDSDGLQIHAASGEWLWRPLINPRGSFVTAFALQSPRGFGLMQRDRRFAAYEDLEARYERRPSVWVEPVGDWGDGRVELLQFHTPDETHDNVAAYWVPQRLPAPGTPIDLRWRLHWAGDAAPAPPGAQVVQTRRGHGYREAPIPHGRLQFQVDFAGSALAALPAASAVEAVASGNANVRGLRAWAFPNAATGGWRMTLEFERVDARAAVELRAFLRHGDRTLSETWALALAPE